MHWIALQDIAQAQHNRAPPSRHPLAIRSGAGSLPGGLARGPGTVMTTSRHAVIPARRCFRAILRSKTLVQAPIDGIEGQTRQRRPLRALPAGRRPVSANEGVRGVHGARREVGCPARLPVVRTCRLLRGLAACPRVRPLQVHRSPDHPPAGPPRSLDVVLHRQPLFQMDARIDSERYRPHRRMAPAAPREFAQHYP